jgi:4-amino-4-deoxy-L-arabinose transferase-like glycosyltransferase
MPLSSIAKTAYQTTTRPTLVQVLVASALVWAGIYLPGLGSIELKHEEPRRTLPAVHMISTGDWLVPRVGEAPYLRKPPLLNWLIAGMFKLAGGRSEWAVRLPSALATLALGLGVVIFGGVWLGRLGGFSASILFLTNLAVLESGRLAELEAVYVCVTGLALVIWLALWYRGVSGLRLWIWPAILLALGLLTKGPTHFIFFYGVIIPVLLFAKQLRALVQPAHGIALLLMVAIFSFWAIPCSLAVGQHDPLGVWQFWIYQITSRASETEAFRWQVWLLNFPQTLKNFLPWTPLLILLWTSGIERPGMVSVTGQITDEEFRARAIFHGSRLGMVVTCVLMCLLPNGSPRYIYPLFVVPCLLIGQVFAQKQTDGFGRGCLRVWHWFNAVLLVAAAVAVLAIPCIGGVNPGSWAGLVIGIGFIVLGLVTQWLKCEDKRPIELAARAALVTGLVFAAGMISYGAAIVPRVDAFTTNGPREVAATIRRALPADAVLWVQEYEYRPYWYYLEPDVRYFGSIDSIPAGAHYFLLPDEAAPTFVADHRWNGHPLHPVTQVLDSEKRRFVVLTDRVGEP